MPNRRYLEDWEKPELTAEELFLAEEAFACLPHLGVADEIVDTTEESDEIIEDVVEAPENPLEDFSGFVFFSDVHSCTPAGDSQQSVNLRLIDFVFCDEPECGGPGGWLTWFSNDPTATPESPENPLLPYK